MIKYKDILHLKKELSPILAIAINNSLNSGPFPDCLKMSIDRPIHKKGPRKDFNNYRPVSLLSALDKVFERYVIQYLNKYLRENNIIRRGQYAFQKEKSSQDLLKNLEIM